MYLLSAAICSMLRTFNTDLQISAITVFFTNVGELFSLDICCVFLSITNASSDANVWHAACLCYSDQQHPML